MISEPLSALLDLVGILDVDPVGDVVLVEAVVHRSCRADLDGPFFPIGSALPRLLRAARGGRKEKPRRARQKSATRKVKMGDGL